MLSGAIAETLRPAHVGPKLTLAVDLSSIQVYETRKKADARALKRAFRKNKVPTGCQKLTGNFAIFRYSNGKHKLLLVVLEKTAAGQVDPECGEAADGVAAVLAYLHRHGVLVCTAESRISLDGEWMMEYGLRLSQNYMSQKDWVTLDVRELSEETAGKYAASRAVDLLVAPYFCGALEEMRGIMAERGCPLTATTGYPFTSVNVTVNYNSFVHLDKGDCAPTFLFWLRHGRVSNGGKFVLPGLKAWFEPKHTTVMLMEATEVAHHTAAGGGV